jgi:hypothetical protein
MHLSNIEVYMGAAVFTAGLVGVIAVAGEHDRKVRNQANQIVKEQSGVVRTPDASKVLVFRKSRLIPVSFGIAALFMLAAGYVDPSIYFNGAPGKRLPAAVLGLCWVFGFALVALRFWIYRVTISDRELTIRALTRKTILFDTIEKIETGALKASSFCVITTRDGKSTEIGSDLVGFLDFVRALAERTKISR